MTGFESKRSAAKDKLTDDKQAAQQWTPNDMAYRPGGLAQPEPSQWRDMVVVNLVREGVNKHRARELADHFAAQRPWQGLTDEEFAEAMDGMNINWEGFDWRIVCLTKIIEAKLKEKK